MAVYRNTYLYIYRINNNKNTIWKPSFPIQAHRKIEKNEKSNNIMNIENNN